VAQRCTDVASRYLYGEALTAAATSGKVDVMEALLESNPEFDLEELTEALNSVCAWGSEEALELLLKHDAKKVLGIQQYSTGLSHAARKNNHQAVVYWLETHPEHHNLVVDPATVIDVSGNGFMDILPPLIEQIRPTDSYGNTLSQCLQVASKESHKEVVEYLIREGADVNTDVEEVGCTSGGDKRRGSRRKLSALQAALIGFERFDPESQYEYMPYLQSSRAAAYASSQQRLIEILLAKGADPNGADGYERCPLNMAAAYCTVEIVRELILSGAHPEVATKEYGTALRAAARRETSGLPIVKALLEANAPVSSIDPDKTAALNEALSFFGNSGFYGNKDDGRFKNSITDVLSTGPGAVVKILLANLPEEKADDSRYGLLVQMACMAGDQECVELLLQRGTDVNDSGNYYGTALQAASRIGNIKIVERLLNSGADVNILEGAHGTALRAAVLGGHEELVRSLIARGADVNLRYKDRGESVLRLALESRNHTIFKTLLVAGADLNTEMLNQQHILIAACKHGDTTLVELLLASGVDVNVSGAKGSRYLPCEEATALNAACAAGHLSVVQFLLDHGADVEKTNGSSATPLIAAIRGNNQSVVCLLLDAGADVNHAVGVTPLSAAAEDCKLEIVKELLSAGAIIGGPFTKRNALTDACNCHQYMVIGLLLEALSGSQYEEEVLGEPLSAAMWGGDDETIRRLLEHGVSPSFDLLRRACSAGVLEAVRLLVDTGIDVNEDDGDDAPLLHVAASHSRPGIVQFLINRGASIMLRSTKYGSPLIATLEGSMAPFLRGYWQPESCRSLAKQLPLPERSYNYRISGGTKSQHKPGYKEVSECEQIVRRLFDAGAEMDATMRDFGNALHLASYMGSEAIVRQLLERMEDVNIFGGYFGSPLIAALKGDHPTIVELLLDRDIDVNHSSPEHGSALHCACVHGSKKLIQSLLDHGADTNAYDDKHGSALAAAASRSVDPIMGRRNFGSVEEQTAIVELLLRHEPKVQIRECDLLVAASWSYWSDGQHFMSLFLRHDQSVIATEAVIVKTIQNNDTSRIGVETLLLLLKHDGGLGTTPAMLQAAEKVEVMEVLLKHKPVCQITADVLASAAMQYGGSKLVKLLLTHDPKAPVSETTITAAMARRSHYDSDELVLKLLLDRNPELNITDKMLGAARAPDDMEMLLKRRNKEPTISSKVLEKVTKHNSKAATLVSQLLEHDKSIKITPPVVHAAIVPSYGKESFMRTLFEHDPTLEITQEDLMNMINEWRSYEDRRKIIDVLSEYGKTVEFTAEIEKILGEKYQSQSDKKVKELFYRLKR
jgi:ankyrin repeat protein